MNASAPIPAVTDMAPDHKVRDGFVLGLVAYGLWGLFPIYFKALDAVPSVDIVAHRIVWSLLVLAALVAMTRGWVRIGVALRDRRTLGLLTLTAVLISINWLFYVYAINSGHILAGSLGYYLNPLANILLGRFILKEYLSKLQWAAVAIAGAGIAVLAAGALSQLWISLILCVSFATYGLLRKIAAADPIAGLSIETAILFPFALGWLVFGHAAGQPGFGTDRGEALLLVAGGIVSTTPLLMFTAAARRLPYSTLGMLQFIAPTLQFIIAVWLYGEAFTLAHAIAFGAIWIALGLYSASLVHTMRTAVGGEVGIAPR